MVFGAFRAARGTLLDRHHEPRECRAEALYSCQADIENNQWEVVMCLVWVGVIGPLILAVPSSVALTILGEVLLL